MRVLLVWPKFSSFSFWNFEKVCELVGVKYMTPPLGLLTVAALLPRDWDLRVVDENVHPLKDQDFEGVDIVFVSSKIVHRLRALEVIRTARARGLRVVVGGPDPTLTPKPYREAGVDCICLGEGELTVPRLLADLARGTLQATYDARGELADLRQTPPPRFDLIDHRNYLYVGIQYSRGCPYRCEFCNVVDIFSNKFRTKTLEQVLAELDLVYSLGYRGQLDFFDDNLVGDMVEVKPFLRGVAAWMKAHHYPFQLSTSVTLNVARDPELLDLLREARFKYFLVGIETPDSQALKRANKPHNVGFSIPEAVDAIYRRAGATVHSGFLLGLDGEAKDIADQICGCVDDCSIPWVMAGVVFPLPGTQLAQRLDREGRLFEVARGDRVLEVARDQISAGLMFRTERPPGDVLRDLVRVMHHAFDPERYLARCAEVASRLNTVPTLMPGVRLFFRNVRTFFRLCVKMTRTRATRGPFWKALFRVLRENPVGLEALATLAVLYLHFQAMLPYCYEQLDLQRAELEKLGEDAWLEKKLGDVRRPALPLAAGAEARA
ncbi:MAG: B12-binding domain-containing radical SAM protein [Myxococcales bacterium]